MMSTGYSNSSLPTFLKRDKKALFGEVENPFKFRKRKVSKRLENIPCRIVTKHDLESN